MTVADGELTRKIFVARRETGRGWGELILQGISYFFLTFGGLSMVVPFLWMVGTSLKPAGEIYQTSFFPSSPTLANYQEVIFRTEFPHWYLNSLIVAIISTTSVAFFDTLAGYTFAKFDFPLKNLMFLLILSTLMVPTEMLIIPWYIMSVKFNWVDTYWGIAFPGVITASGVFLMRQFMTGVPNELIDAARIDGLWEFGIFYRIAVPLVKPAIAALCIFNFLGNWNAFIWPLIVTSKRLTMTLPVGLSFFSGEAGSDWHLIMTGATLSVIPLMTVVIIFQRQIIQGIALTGLKA
ncbi:MAG TPA: carbohydrate ABC transporter permease [Caldilineae bacterium]|nr:carbohydrate ABC transporter permease [Caldilineae bacterium]